ncbi:hypothetical protein CMI37_18460 [Candidatus Pacearchaeota archaeon]|nr:hypothetical protein [Candidatus Pacearchaeota archaeon]|tara:strand:- start:2153 stop:2338 length:186 start_codon:yes stop_codon:yes gene_type:complete
MGLGDYSGSYEHNSYFGRKRARNFDEALEGFFDGWGRFIGEVVEAVKDEAVRRGKMRGEDR